MSDVVLKTKADSNDDRSLITPEDGYPKVTNYQCEGKVGDDLTGDPCLKELQLPTGGNKIPDLDVGEGAAARGSGGCWLLAANLLRRNRTPTAGIALGKPGSNVGSVAYVSFVISVPGADLAAPVLLANTQWWVGRGGMLQKPCLTHIPMQVCAPAEHRRGQRLCQNQGHHQPSVQLGMRCLRARMEQRASGQPGGGVHRNSARLQRLHRRCRSDGHLQRGEPRDRLQRVRT